MTRRRLLRNLDTAQITQAIERAEARTSGEIRVSVAGFFRGEPRHLAESAFSRLGMRATRHRNGVLILLAPTRRQVVILGDDGVHACVGGSFWADLAKSLSTGFRGGDFTGSLTAAIEHIGEKLATHFPPERTGNPNELPNDLDIGRPP